jgi:predicted MPP superfamily phosphohydrolase
MKMPTLFFSFFAFAGLMAAYITWRLFGAARFSRIGQVAIALGIFAIFLAVPLNIMLRRAGVNNAALEMLVWAGYVGVGFLSFIFTFLAIRDFLWVPAVLFKNIKRFLFENTRENLPTGNPAHPGRRRFLVTGMNYGITATASIFTAYGFAEARQVPDVKEVTIPIIGLPDDFEGFRIVQITDIHVSPTIRRDFVEAVVHAANRLDADIIALTGDLADGLVSQLADDVAPLKDLKSAAGNFFVTGNHEYYSGVDDWVRHVKRLGFTPLMNEHRLISRGKSRLLLAGVTDYRGGNFIRSHLSDPRKALAGAPSVHPKILLAHQPKNIFDAAKAGFDLQISGHTHGGQFFPWNLLVGLDQPFVAGLGRYHGTQIYVSRGTGYWGPPIRVGSPSEITRIKLTARQRL